MESRVRRMFQFRFCEPLMVVDKTVADKLNLRNTRNGLQIRMEDGLGL